MRLSQLSLSKRGYGQILHRNFWHAAIKEFLSSNKHILEPTAIQRLTKDSIKKGDNTVVLAETGSGKTYSYLLPIVEHILEKGPRRTLILVPTFELQNQTRSLISELDSIGSISENFRVLTPGKLKIRDFRLDLLRESQTIVIDEADSLLGGGTESLLTYFINDAIGIERKTQPFQWLFVAATWPRHVANLVKDRWSTMVPLKSDQLHKPVNTLVEHFEHSVDEADRRQKLIQLLNDTASTPTLIFVNTRDSAELLYNQLKDSFSVDRIHNGLKSIERREKIIDFKRGKVLNLICTDSMSRGLDFNNVPQIIQYEFAKNAIDYLHRIGRTARSGAHGTAYHMVMPIDEALVKHLQSQAPTNLESLFSRRRSFTRQLKRIQN